MENSNVVSMDFGKGQSDRLSSQEKFDLRVKKHESFSDMLNFIGQFPDDAEHDVFSVIKADNATTKNLQAFMFLCATDNEKAQSDFDRLRLGELGVSKGDLAQEVSFKENGYQILNEIKMRVSSFKGEFSTDEMNDIRKLLNINKIGHQFKQQVYNQSAEPPANIVHL